MGVSSGPNLEGNLPLDEQVLGFCKGEGRGGVFEMLSDLFQAYRSLIFHTTNPTESKSQAGSSNKPKLSPATEMYGPDRKKSLTTNPNIRY